MPEFKPVRTIDDFAALDEGDVLEGYLDGFHGAPLPGSNRSRAYWHGWCKGQVESGRREPDAAQLELDAGFKALCLELCGSRSQ
jgi:hypothetical protein